MAIPERVDRKAYRFDYSDFAQEFLRRNSEYRVQYGLLTTGSRLNIYSVASRRMARSWGLEFPGRS